MPANNKPSGYGLPFSLKDPSKVRVTIETGSQPIPFCGCWLWLGSLRNRYGYGGVHVGKQVLLAHRAAYAAFNGEIPAKAVVMHKCDTPLCVNPEHLTLGSVCTNMRDMYDKGRKSTLSKADVLKIREMLPHYRTKTIADAFNVKPDAIRRIATGFSWKDAE